MKESEIKETNKENEPYLLNKVSLKADWDLVRKF
jgi:hypothetical protein